MIAELPLMTGIGTIIIDDFHRLDEATKHSIADFLKELADKEDAKTKIVLIGINKAGDSLVHFAPDLNNRIDTIPSRSIQRRELLPLRSNKFATY